MTFQTPCVIWRFSDGKPGHENQTQGLIHALQAYGPVAVYTIPLTARPQDYAAWPKPTLLIGTGHTTHWPLWRAQRTTEGKSIVLMKPSIPTLFFDLCIIPAHDQPRPSPRVLITQGVLNTIIPANQPRQTQGLILLGGLSRHFQWDNARIIPQIEAILAAEPKRAWELTTSRRTPPALLAQLPVHPRLHVTPYPQADSQWVRQRLQSCAAVWVSPDSVSMVYEALTAGAAVGLLRLMPSKIRPSRVIQGLKSLVQQQQLTPFEAWLRGQPLKPPVTPLFEADRCARWIVQQWLR